MTNQTTLRKAVMIAAHQLRKQGYSFGEAQKLAWNKLRNRSFQIVEFFAKKYGKIIQRVVSTDITKYYEPTGNGRPKPEGLKTLVDLAKWAGDQKNFIIAAWHPKVVAAAA